MKKWTSLSSLVLALCALTATSALACDPLGQTGIFPKNSARIPAGPMGAFTVQESFFQAVITKMEKLYAPVFAAQGRKLEVERDWQNEEVNAFARRSGKTSIVHMYGGLARHPLVTEDAFTLVLCHELGHHLSGAPKNHILFFTQWSSNEGQSDYFASLKCAREAWQADDNVTIVSAMKVPAEVAAACRASFADLNEAALCERSSMAGMSLAATLNSLRDPKDRVNLDFMKPDPKKVRRTFNQHPEAQCRLDTYFAGAVCSVDKSVPLSPKDATAGTCSTEKGETVGTRPLCWYRPKS